MLERKKAREETIQIAWNCLNKLKYATWIWLGSSRDQSIKSLINYLESVNSKDEIAPTTQNLFIQIAITSEETLILSRELTKKNATLKKALNQLIQLKRLRDEDRNLKPTEAARFMIEAIANLNLLIDYSINEEDRNYPIKKLSSPQKQEWRMFG